MKKTIILLLVIALFLIPVSCKQESGLLATPSLTPISTPSPLETDLPVYEKPSDDGTIYLYAVDMPFRHMFAEDCDEWEEYMLERHGVVLELEYITYSYDMEARRKAVLDAGYGIEVSELEYLRELNGFVILPDIYSLSKLCSSGLLMPVNEFIAEIPGYFDLPDEILGGYTDKDGNIWALPTGSDIALPRRIYNKEWLEAYGKGEPRNLDEFYEYARYVAFEDPDGNGVDDTYIAAYSPHDILRSLGDIFTHLGCRQVGYYPIGYDPDKEEFINVCETTGFSEAMAAIKMMVDEGLLIEDSGWAYILEEPESFDYKVASVMGMAYYPEYFNGCVIGDYWPGTDGKASVPVWVDHMGLAVLRDTQDVAAKFNALYDIAASGTNGYMDLLAGMEGNEYEIEGELINYWLTTPEGEDNPMVGLNMQIALDKGKSLQIVYNRNDQNSEMDESSSVVDEIKEKNTVFLSSPDIYVVPFAKEGYRLWNLRLYTMNPFTNLVSNIVHSRNSLEMAVHSYNQKLLADGVYDILEEINGESSE